MRTLTLTSLMVVCGFKLFAQQLMLLDEQSIRIKEEQLKLYGDSILKGSHDSVRISACNNLRFEMKNVLQSPNTFNYSFDSIKNVSKIISDDGNVRIYTWILPTDSGSKYQYYGFIQYRNTKKKIFKVIELQEAQIDSALLLKKQLKADQWYGALYYKIIETKNKKTTYYTLLGWKGNNKQTTKKVIDVLTFNNNEAQFGVPILQFEKKTQLRIIFEFNAEVSMLLHWDENIHKIVFDHLAPSNPAFKNQKQSYGPDLTYDALQWKKGKWNYFHDIDVRNEDDSNKPGFTDKKKREFYNPPKD